MDLKRSKSYRPRSGEVETLGPVSMPKKSKMFKKNLLKSLVIIFVVAATCGSAYLFKEERDKNYSYTNQISSLSNEVDSLKSQQQVSPTSETAAGQTEAQPVLELPVVVFTPNGVFSDEDKKELTDKVIDPMVDYTPDVYVSIDVEIYSQDKFVGGSTDDKYIISTVGKPGKGGTGGFIYGSKTKGIDYWVPDCLNKCEFSDEYKAKYPEVVDKYNQANGQ